MAVISAFFNSDTGEIIEEKESGRITATQVMHMRRFHDILHTLLNAIGVSLEFKQSRVHLTFTYRRC